LGIRDSMHTRPVPWSRTFRNHDGSREVDPCGRWCAVPFRSVCNATRIERERSGSTSKKQLNPSRLSSSLWEELDARIWTNYRYLKGAGCKAAVVEGTACLGDSRSRQLQRLVRHHLCDRACFAICTCSDSPGVVSQFRTRQFPTSYLD
jgi:hypothetical protein